jgi:CRISPR/Cas system CSM-associated protein Csm2 small subunit
MYNNSPVYQGKASKYQTERTTIVQSVFEKDPFNAYQNFLYRRALYGLNVYSPEEIQKMHGDKKKRILKVNKRAQTLINLLKQQHLISVTNNIFRKFYKSSLAQEICKNEEIDSEVKCTLDFKDLKLSKETIVQKLIDNNILPRNFYELKETDFNLSR